MKRDLYVATSGIAGKGVFTKKSFKNGQTILLLKGQQREFIVKNKDDALVGPNWVGVGKNLWIDVEDGVVRYINHSCNPNMGIKGRVTFTALRNISVGEEVVFDYSITEEDLLWRMKNGENETTKNCRPIICSIQSLPPEVYESYLPYIPTYFQKVYRRYHNLK